MRVGQEHGLKGALSIGFVYNGLGACLGVDWEMAEGNEPPIVSTQLGPSRYQWWIIQHMCTFNISGPHERCMKWV